MSGKLKSIILLITVSAMILNVYSLGFGQVSQPANDLDDLPIGVYPPILSGPLYPLTFLYPQWNIFPPSLQPYSNYLLNYPQPYPNYFFNTYPSRFMYLDPYLYYPRSWPFQPNYQILPFQALWYLPFEQRPAIERDSDGDGVPNSTDGCPNDANKTAPGICGCGVSDVDSDSDGTADCDDGCPNDPNKTATGVCGCGVSDVDSDSDGTADCDDGCPNDANKTATGVCGCGVSDVDSDSDGTADCDDGCPNDVNKVAPGICGCGVSDVDTDGDGTADCDDGCPNDPNKTATGVCGCGVSDVDTDGDGTADCDDGCPNDVNKVAPGICGCGVSDVDTDGDGTADCDDGCPNDPNKVAPGICGCGVSDVDTDSDGTANCNDGCPNDPNKVAPGICGCGVSDVDTDGDGTADCNDECPNDANKTAPGVCGCGVSDVDTDSDGTANCNDGCPNDPNKVAPGICGCGVSDVDTDGDGTADCIDNCPNDPNPNQEDADSDGLGDACDPNTFRIQGFVSGNGIPVSGAEVKIGSSTVIAFTDDIGTFDVKVGIAELIDHPDPDNRVFPIGVSADDFATAYYNVPFEPEGDLDYQVEIRLIAVSDVITEEDDVTDPNGVDIEKEGEKVGELYIPSDALPFGVTDVTGEVTYIDPTTSDLGAFPGADFLGAPADGNQPVLLESFGAMHFDLEDQDGNPITQLDGNATVCMKVPDSLAGAVSEGEEIPLWYYDPNTGLWQEQGSGIVEERDSNEFWICGLVSHFTWWNYDRPIPEHACFKFYFVDANTGAPITDLHWYAEGVTYSSDSPQRTCTCDENDPQPPCFDEGMTSLTVKKSQSGMPPEQIKVYTLYLGTRYYLEQEGDGTYQTTTDPNEATIFDVPEENASCVSDFNVAGCHFLDEDDPLVPEGSGCAAAPTLPVCGNNGILPLSTINRTPVITSFEATPPKVAPGGISYLQAIIHDPEDDDFGVTWSATCGGIENIGMDPNSFEFHADFNAPDYEAFCKVTIEATDTHGNSSNAWVYIQVGEITGYIEGTIFGTNGQPLENAEVSLRDSTRSGGTTARFLGGIYSDTNAYDRTVYTDPNGYYRFDEVPCCRLIDGGMLSFSGEFDVLFEVDDTTWTYRIGTLNMNCCESLIRGCELDVHLPTVWGGLQGIAYDVNGDPNKIDEWVRVGIAPQSSVGQDYMYGNISLFAYDSIGENGAYGPVPVPVGQGVMQTVNIDLTQPYNDRQFFIPAKDQLVDADIGPGATGTVTGTVYDDSGMPVDPNIPVRLLARGYTYTLTDESGVYTFTDVPVGKLYVEAEIEANKFRSNYGMLNQRGGTATINVNNSGCSISGVLFDWQGMPLPLVDVYLYVYWGVDYVDWTEYFMNYTDQTDINGVFVFSGVHNGSARFNSAYTDPATGIEGIVYLYDIGISQACPGPFTIDLPMAVYPLTTGDCYIGYLPQ